METLLLVRGLGLIFVAAEIFTNAIEWFGKRLSIAEGAVGSVLAAIGTALPETSVAIVAVAAHKKAHTEAGIGAILGAPMMLSTLALFITGAAALFFAAKGIRSKKIKADYRVVGHDLRSFFMVYILALVAALIPIRSAKIAIAVVLILIYVRYVYRTFKGPSTESGEEMRPLHFHRSADIPRMRFIILQLIIGLGLMVFGAKLFVNSISVIAASVGISALVLSVIITPIATELPEKFNSITWMRHRKDTLALGNITGAMVFQSSMLPAIGILVTPWTLNPQAIASIVIAILATIVAWADMTIRKKLSPYALMCSGALYLLYPLCIFWIFPKVGIH